MCSCSWLHYAVMKYAARLMSLAPQEVVALAAVNTGRFEQMPLIQTSPYCLLLLLLACRVCAAVRQP
jgi:hypothetical protein